MRLRSESTFYPGEASAKTQTWRSGSERNAYTVFRRMRFKFCPDYGGARTLAVAESQLGVVIMAMSRFGP